MKVSAIVVTYNRVKLLKECIQCLLKQSYKLNNIIIINNNSSDGTEEYLNELNNNNIIVKNMHKNLGGAGGFYTGVKVAYTETDSDFFWLMDDDTMPTATALYKLIIGANELNNNFGFLCSNVRIWKDNSTSVMNIPSLSIDWMEHLDKHLIQAISASFVSLLIQRKAVKKVGYPIAQMFIWGDDVEYTTRLSTDFKSYLVTNSIVMHKSNDNNKAVSYRKGTTNKDTGNVFNIPIRKLFYYKCMYRNRLYTSKKYYKYPDTVKMLLEYVFTLVRIPFLSHNYRIKRFVYTLSGIINGLFFNPKIDSPKLDSKKKDY